VDSLPAGWRTELINVFVDPRVVQSGTLDTIRETLARVIGSPAGKTLIDDLLPGYGGRRSLILEFTAEAGLAAFRDARPSNDADGDDDGHDEPGHVAGRFRENTPKANRDTLKVRFFPATRAPAERMERYKRTIGYSDCDFIVRIADEESEMASTVFHELLHAFFLRVLLPSAQEDDDLLRDMPTGHTAGGCTMHPEFRKRMGAFYRDLEALERKRYGPRER
jgi:hypothetical protein